MATESQSALYKAYKARKKAEGKPYLDFSKWNWRARNLAKARAARGIEAIEAKPTPKRVKSTTQTKHDDGLVRTQGRVNARVDLMGEKNGLACMVIDRADTATALKALRGYKPVHAKSEAYTSKRGLRDKVYITSDNIANARKALVGAGLQPVF